VFQTPVVENFAGTEILLRAGAQHPCFLCGSYESVDRSSTGLFRWLRYYHTYVG